jgi:predicted HicB family RNase H-like nuclease
MADWRKKLPKPKADPKKMVHGVMVRPNEKTCRWLYEQAEKHRVSVNKIVLAIIEAAASP